MKKNLGGYTLIEILVAVAIFFTMISVPMGFFILSLKGQRRALALREIIDNSSYALEYTSRALRMAKKDLTGSCIDDAGSNYQNPGPPPKESKIKFLNYRDVCQRFHLVDSQLKERREEAGWTEFLPLTSDNLEITLLKFQLSGQEQGDGLQPRVTILFEIQKKGQPGTKIRLQTTVSQRNLDATY